MEKDMNQPPLMCRSGCGFYGSSATDGLCSKCFKDSLKKTNDLGRISPTTGIGVMTKLVENNSEMASTSASGDLNPNMLSAPMLCSPAHSSPMNIFNSTLSSIGEAHSCEDMSHSPGSSFSDSASLSGASAPNGGPIDVPKKKSNRCDKCKKKVGLTGFECRCGGLFCATHRYSDMHECAFDYKALGAAEIAKNNPVVKREKIQKL